MKIELSKSGYYHANPKPSEEELAAYYQANYVENKLQNSREYTDAEIEHKSLGCKEAQFVVSRQSISTGSFLDIGCGEGFYLKHFSDLGWSVTGLDYSMSGVTKNFPYLANCVCPGDVLTSVKKLILEEKKFQLITLNHVLEHVTNPDGIIQDIKSLLTDNGVLRVSVPNDYSFLQKHLLENQYVNKEYWICLPDHLNYFNSDSARDFMIKSGFKVQELLAEFPIELFLLHSATNYVNDTSVGKDCHYARVEAENLLARESIDKLIAFRRGCGAAGLGRAITLYCTLN